MVIIIDCYFFKTCKKQTVGVSCKNKAKVQNIKKLIKSKWTKPRPNVIPKITKILGSLQSDGCLMAILQFD